MGYKELSPRQKEILEYIAQGKSDAEISNFLHIEKTTVRSHLEVICDELGVTEEGKRGTYKRIKASKEFWKHNMDKLCKP